MRALITGITGQDGPYLARHLLSLGYEVHGAYRREATAGFTNLDFLGIRDRVKLVPLEITEYESVRHVIIGGRYDEIYNLAAQSHVGLSFKMPIATLLSTGLGVAHILEAVRALGGEGPKIYQASTSELFGGDRGVDAVFDETDVFHPRSPYACAKEYAYSMMVNYREAYDMYTCNGILFNHESPLRGPNFVTRKVTMAAARIVHALRHRAAYHQLEIGNVDATRDWGHAADFVRAMHLMLQQDEPKDYVVATEKNHSIRELVNVAFRGLGYEGHWSGEGLDAVYYIDNHGNTPVAKVNPKFYRPSDCTNLTGSSKKARMELGWEPEYDFDALITEMVTEDYKRITE